MKDADLDVVGQIAGELGITTKQQLASMDLDTVRQLIESGDVDPSVKARLVRVQLKKMRDIVDIADRALSDSVAEEAIEPSKPVDAKYSKSGPDNGKSRAA